MAAWVPGRQQRCGPEPVHLVPSPSPRSLQTALIRKTLVPRHPYTGLLDNCVKC